MLPWLPMYMIIILEIQKIGTLWNDLPNEVKESGSLEGFELNYRFYIG